MNRDRIIDEVISEVINKKCMLNEYKNQEDCEIIRQYADGLEEMYNRILKSGLSRHEITMSDLAKIIKDLRKLEHEMSI